MTPPPAYENVYFQPQDVSRQEWTEAWQYEQSWQSSSHLPPRPSTTGRGQPQDFSIARTMNQGGAFVDRVGARLNDMLSRTGGDNCSPDEIDALARELDAVEIAEPATRGDKQKQKDYKEKAGTGINKFQEVVVVQEFQTAPQHATL